MASMRRRVKMTVMSKFEHRHLVKECVSVSEASEPAHKMKRRSLLDIVTDKSSFILELLASKDQALLIGRDAWGARYQHQERVSSTHT